MDENKNNKEILDYNIFGEELKSYMMDENVTDIEWNGWQLWITDLRKGKYCVKDVILKESFIESLCVKLGNIMGTSINRDKPVLEADTEDRRISICHKSVAGHTSIVIRRNELGLKVSRKYLLDTKYCDKKVLNFLENCVIAHLSGFTTGLVNAGKTEFIRYLSLFFTDNEKTGVYENNQEFHYRYINPSKDSVEVKIMDNDDKLNGLGLRYKNAIRMGLRHNVKRIVLSEARGEEAYELIDAISSGSSVLSTLHCDNTLYTPERLFLMMGNRVSQRYLDTIYTNLDFSVLVEYDFFTNERHLTEISLHDRDEGRDKDKNYSLNIYNRGKWYIDNIKELPANIQRKFDRYDIKNIFERQDFEKYGISYNEAMD